MHIVSLREISTLMLIALFGRIVVSSCPTSNTSKCDLHFVEKMVKNKIVVFDTFVDISCCFEGCSEIKWEFRNSSKHNWSDILPEGCELSSNNTNLQIFKFGPGNIGFYKCNASDNQGGSVAHVTQLVRGHSEKNSDMIIKKVVQQTDFYEHDKGRICCSMETHETDIRIQISWTVTHKSTHSSCEFLLTGQQDYLNLSLPLNRGVVWKNLTKINTNMGKEQSTIVIHTCVEVFDLRINDSGNYMCLFQKMDDTRNFSLILTVTKKPDHLYATLMSIAISGLVIMALAILIWVSYYDILLAIKRLSVCSSDNRTKTDLLIVYDDSDVRNLFIALLIAKSLSLYDISCYIFDRDKTYGATIHDDCLMAISGSKTVLFLFTQLTIENPKVVFCFKNCKQKKIYIFHPTRKSILKELSLVDVERTIYDSVKTSRDYYRWRSDFLPKSFAQRRLIKWILTKLPNYHSHH